MPRYVSSTWDQLSGFYRYQSLQHLSLSEATTLGFLGPIGTGILGYLVLKEPFTRKEATAGGKSRSFGLLRSAVLLTAYALSTV